MLWPLFKRRPAVSVSAPVPAPELTNEAFRRWLRAFRPSMPEFLRMSELEQEQLAQMGDEYVQDVVVAVGYAVADPRLAEAGINAAAGDTSAEETLAKTLAQNLAAKLVGTRKPPEPKPEPVSMPRETFAGFGERKKAESAHAKPKSLFGKLADLGTKV